MPLKLEYVLGGISGLSLSLYDGGFFQSVAPTPDGIPFGRARRWKTYAGIQRFIRKERAAGSDWQYVVIPVPARPDPEIIRRKLPEWHVGSAEDHAARPLTGRNAQ